MKKTANHFEKTSKTLEREMFWKKIKYTAYIVALVVIIIVILVLIAKI